REDVFERLHRPWTLKVDLFASLWNRQLDSFVSWGLQPGALAVDAFSVNWRWIRGYALPPFCLIQKVLSKTMRDEAEITLIAPWWPAQAWFPTVLELVSEPPLVLPTEGILTGPLGQSHPLAGSLILIAWRLSGKSFKPRAFRRKWSSYSWKELVSPRQLLISQRGRIGLVGTFDRVRMQ
ncbi:Uncharacterized protein APZ42_000894, partial [Daphnia magna]